MIRGPSKHPISIHEFFYRETNRNYHMPAHIQRATQWYCVIHGCVEQCIDGQSFTLQSQESVLIPAQAVREPRARSKSVGYIVCTFENHRLELESMLRRKIHCPATLLGELQALVTELRSGTSTEQQDMLFALLPRILIGLRRTLHGKPGGRLPLSQSSAPALNLKGHLALVAKLENYMRENLQVSLERADLARAIHLSPSHLARIFRATTGKTLIERLTELRLAQACAMLAESALPITRISLDVGFNSFSHFTSLFKKKIGVSPSNYRKSGGCSWAVHETS